MDVAGGRRQRVDVGTHVGPVDTRLQFQFGTELLDVVGSPDAGGVHRRRRRRRRRRDAVAVVAAAAAAAAAPQRFDDVAPRFQWELPKKKTPTNRSVKNTEKSQSDHEIYGHVYRMISSWTLISSGFPCSFSVFC